MRVMSGALAGPLLLGALALLAGCGNRGFNNPDGSFDRDGYRTWMNNACRIGMATGENDLTSEQRERFCGCMTETMLSHSDEEMRASVRDRQLQRRWQRQGFARCGAEFGLQPGPTLSAEEPPPPEEPGPNVNGSPLIVPPHNVFDPAAANRDTQRSIDDLTRRADQAADEATRAADEALRQAR